MNFDRSFRLILYATAIWAFGALAATGQLHTTAILIGFLFLLLPAFDTIRKIRFPPLFWTFLSVAAFILALLGIFVVGEILYSIVYFFLFIEGVKLWTAERSRDILQILILSFFQIVAASVMTASLSFALTFTIYVFLLTVAWIMFSIRRDVEALAAMQGEPGGKWSLHRIRAALNRRHARQLAKHHAGRLLAPPRPLAEDVESVALRMKRWPILTLRFSLFAAWLSFLLVTGSVAIFLIIPRLSAQRLLAGFGQMKGSPSSGFSDQVDFRNVGQIQLDPTIVARVQILASSGTPQAASRPDYLRLRGSSLDQYTGLRWQKNRLSFGHHWPLNDSSFNFLEAAPEGMPLVQMVTLEAGGDTILFGASCPVRYRFDRPIQVNLDCMSDSVQTISVGSQPLRYQVTSVIASGVIADSEMENEPIKPSGDILRSARKAMNQSAARIQSAFRKTWGRMEEDQGPLGTYMLSTRSNSPTVLPPRGAAKSFSEGTTAFVTLSLAWSILGNSGLPSALEQAYTDLPDVPDMASVRQLAAQWTPNARTPLQAAQLIETRLRSGYSYSTKIQYRNPDRHLTEFLTERREGHCEYFATAMALMLRSLNIPARLVTGYYTDDWNESGGYFIVRRQHAHSWVEAWIEPHGWVTFDPSPTSGIGFGRIGGSWLLPIQHWLDAMRFQWYRHVIDYDLQDQYQMAGRMVFYRSRASGLMRGLFDPVRNLLSGQALRSRGIRPLHATLFLSLFALGGIIAWLLTRELFRRPGREKLKTGERRKSISQAEWLRAYYEVLDALAARQFERRPGQTPQEFASEVVARRKDWDELMQVTRAYYRARFRNEPIPPEELARARNLIDHIRTGAVASGLGISS